MKALLNRGINFAICPQKLNISEMLADHQRLARGMTWMDYFSGQDSDSSPSTKPKIFKQRKTNLPSSKKYKPPEDKGGGLIILNTDEYLCSCHAHLSSVRTNEDGSESPYYRRVEADILDEAKTEILSVLKDGKDQGIISDVEFQVMDPTDKGPARFYETFKVLKSHEPGQSSPAPDQSP